MRYRFRHCANVIGTGMWNQLDEVEPLRAMVAAHCCHHLFHTLSLTSCRFSKKNKDSRILGRNGTKISRNWSERNPSTKKDSVQFEKVIGKKKNCNYFISELKIGTLTRERERERPWDWWGRGIESSASNALEFRVRRNYRRDIQNFEFSPCETKLAKQDCIYI